LRRNNGEWQALRLRGEHDAVRVCKVSFASNDRMAVGARRYAAHFRRLAFDDVMSLE
jgi:hypothetical protein